MLPVLAVSSASVVFEDTAAQRLFDDLRNGNLLNGTGVVIKCVDGNNRDRHGNTLLVQATGYLTPALIEFLLARCADTNATNETGCTARDENDARPGEVQASGRVRRDHFFRSSKFRGRNSR
jgi:hypothetical protein